MCDGARGRVYKGGPLPLWTTRRHHIITKEKHNQSYLMVTHSRRPVRHACLWPEWSCHLGGSSELLGAKAPWTCLSSITSGACRALPSTRTVPCSDSIGTNSLGLNGSGPAVTGCRRKPARWLLTVSWSRLDTLAQRKDGCSFGRARSVENGGRSPASPRR